ncbi:MAG TPA: tRNA lysidine(34) synthetase TilS [Eggerthellaceae bacterium]|nr:tRNA lysidine(34) synthetase TilS [Eggerthellaceae bacterium]
MNVIEKALATISAHDMAHIDAPVLLMVSGGSDSTALAYIAKELRDADKIGPLTMLHVNHRLRGADADADEDFVRHLAEVLGIPFVAKRIDVASIAQEEHGNIEAVARRERYKVANDALADVCRMREAPISQGRMFVAHTADDRIENFYMRSIVGTGPGGFRSMLYLNGQVARPLLDVSRQDLRDYVIERIERELPVVRDEHEMLWREDATNEHTDRFRAYVRHEIVPRALERNPRLVDTLTRTMNLIGDEDDMLDKMATDLFDQHVMWLEPAEQGCVLSPWLAAEALPLQRRVAIKVLERFLGADERIDTATVEAVLAAFHDGKPVGGYVANVQGNLAVSANKQGVRIEPMASFRIRRKK